MFIDHTNRRVPDVIEGRDKHLVVNYLRANKELLFDQLEEVTCDMWDAYANATAEVFGEKVRVTIDRFHVMKNFQEQLTDARREIQRTLSKEEAKALKGSRWLWVKNGENLTEQERTELEGLKQRFPLLKQLAEQRENLRAIFEDKEVTTAADGRERLREGGEELRELFTRLLGQRRRPAARMRDDEEDLHLVRRRREHGVLELRQVAAGWLHLVGEPVLGHADRGEPGRLRPEHLGLRKCGVALLGHVGRRPDHHRRSTRERGRRQCERCDPCDDHFEHPGTHDGHGYASHQK